MFKERLIEVGMVILCLVCVGLLGAFMGWVINVTHFFDLLDIAGAWLRQHNWIFLVIFAGLILYGIGRFIYWLFIEPFRKQKG